MEGKGEQIKLSFGAELELSDVDRSVDIPKELGSWEGPKIAGYYLGSELDIVNTKGEWRGVATDPLCIKCPVGGEIHVNPSYTIDSQMIRIMKIFELFNQIGVACPNHGHIHVCIPGIKQDFDTLKRFCVYCLTHERDVFRVCCGYDEAEREQILSSSLPPAVKSYLLYGDAKINADSVLKAVENATSVTEILEALKNSEVVNYDWHTRDETSVPGSHRTCINLYNLVKGDTVEFRVFRASINPVEIYSSLKFVEMFVQEALSTKEKKLSVEELVKKYRFKFAPLNFDEELAYRWSKTRESKGRCGCLKKYSGCLEPVEDSLIETIAFNEKGKLPEVTTFEKGLLEILNLCKIDVAGYTIDDLRQGRILCSDNEQ